jgi:predicted nucleotidyltransferase
MAAPCQLHAVVKQQLIILSQSNAIILVFMRLREQLRRHKEAIRAMALAHGARDIRVFGSVARGEDGPESDIDFLVDLEKGRTLFDLARLEVELERLLQAPVDVTTERGLREPVRVVALREAIRV